MSGFCSCAIYREENHCWNLNCYFITIRNYAVCTSAVNKHCVLQHVRLPASRICVKSPAPLTHDRSSSSETISRYPVPNKKNLPFDIVELMEEVEQKVWHPHFLCLCIFTWVVYKLCMFTHRVDFYPTSSRFCLIVLLNSVLFSLIIMLSWTRKVVRSFFFNEFALSLSEIYIYTLFLICWSRLLYWIKNACFMLCL